MRIGLICPDLYGHLNPLTSLGHELAQRGHVVTVFAGAIANELAARQGLEHVALGDTDNLSARSIEAWQRLGQLSGVRSMWQSGRAWYYSSLILKHDLPKALDANPVDGLIIDQVSPAAVPAATAREIPFVVAANALAIHYGPTVPPPPLPWRYRGDAVGRWRNRVAWQTIKPFYEWMAGSRAIGTRATHLIFEHDHGLARISQQPAVFEFPDQPHPDHFHFTAPWHAEGRDDHDDDFPWDRLDDAVPMIYASMGTLQNNQQHVFGAIAESVRDLPVQLVLSRGGAAGELEIHLPDNVIMVPRAPQLKLLDRAAFVMTHSGLNTTLECLVRGVPMICLPVTNDQPGVARRVEWLGCGEVLPVQRVRAARLRALVKRFLTDESYARNAAALKAQLPIRSGVELAADVVELALTERHRITRDQISRARTA